MTDDGPSPFSLDDLPKTMNEALPYVEEGQWKDEVQSTPKRSHHKKAPAAEKKATPSGPGFTKQLTETYVWIALLLGLVDPLPAEVLEAQAPKMGEASNKVVMKHEALKKLIAKLSETTAYAELAAAFAPVLAAFVLAHVPIEDKSMAFRLLRRTVEASGVDVEKYLVVAEEEAPPSVPPLVEELRQSGNSIPA